VTNPIPLSIVVGTTRRDGFGLFLKSLKHVGFPFQLVIADASEEEHAVWSPEVFKINNLVSYSYWREWPPQGFIKGYNAAIKYGATGDFVVWLNDDCELEPGWGEAVFKHMAEHSDVIGAMFFSDIGTKYRVCSYCGMLYANFGIIKRDLGNQLGWFDERLFMYGGDTAISVLALSYGISTIPIPGCHIRHARQESGHAVERNTTARKSDLAIFGDLCEPWRAKIKAIGCETHVPELIYDVKQ
jgi:GT2 family glycosyltransferase